MTLPASNPMRRDSDRRRVEYPGADWGQWPLWKLAAPTSRAMMEGRTVPQLVSEQAATRPDAPAITDGRRVLTYQELDARSSQLASRLRSLGVESEDLVGICLERSISNLVVALGVMKAGGAFVPLDPSYPPDRLGFMLKDARPKVVVTRSSLTRLLPEGDWHFLTLDGMVDETNDGDIATSAPAPRDLAYVIYTSGSTGTPKGVEITHGSLRSLLNWHQQAFIVTWADRATHLASPSFDAAVWEVWPYLAMGASVHLPADSIRTDPEALRDWLVEQGITISFVPTPIAERLLALPWPKNTALRFMLTGGDTLHGYPPSGLPFDLVNNYGPTESTVVATSGIISPEVRPTPAPPIGRAISGTEVFILDEQLRPASAGTVGEIHIGGAGLARGYLHQPDLTRQKFIPNPWADGAIDRLYKTGDLARWLPDGQIEFLGRADDQIKIRGYRIEPNEIVNALASHSSIQASLALARADKDQEKRLVAYVVLRPDQQVTANALREFLRAKLPDYMIPSAFVCVEAFPMTPNGKVDRAALPAPAACNTLREVSSDAPLNPVESEVASILAELLEVESVGRDDNFFLLGGHSLMGTQLIVQIREVFGVEMSLASLFDRPTLGAIAAEIDRLRPGAEGCEAN